MAIQHDSPTAWPDATEAPESGAKYAAGQASSKSVHPEISVITRLVDPFESLANSVSKMYLDTFEKHRLVFKECRATAAVLVNGDEPLPECNRINITAEATLTYFGSPRRLLVCTLKDEDKIAERIPCVDMAVLKEVIQRSFKQVMPEEGPFMWPVLHQEVATALFWVQTHALLGHFHSKPTPCWKRFLIYTRMLVPSCARPFIRSLHDQIGPDTAYMFARADLFAQKLWFLALWCLIAILVDVDPYRVSEVCRDGVRVLARNVTETEPCEEDDGSRRILWEVYKAGIFVWGLIVWFLNRNRNSVHIEDGDDQGIGHILMSKIMRSEYSRAKLSQKPDRISLVFKALPTILLFIGLVATILFLTTQLIVYLIYSWGECIKRDCTTPQDKHGFGGWLAEVGVDITLAIIFEICFALTNILAKWVSALRAFETLLDKQISEQMLNVLLNSIERLGTFAILAFWFTPQWKEPAWVLKHGGRIDKLVNCSDLLFGRKDMWCYARKLPAKSRRLVFQKAFKGPFVVAPFVGMIVKVAVPMLAWRLDKSANRIRCCCCRAGECCLDGFFHILALIFEKDCEMVGCFKYVLKGWPFQDINLVQHASSFTQSRPVVLQPAGQTVAPQLAESCNGDYTMKQIEDDRCEPGKHVHPGHEKQLAPRTEDSEEDLVNSVLARTADGILKTATTCAKVAGLKHRPQASKEDLVNSVLARITRKVFSPLDELLEMKLSFLWIMYFAPIMPVGIFPTLIARILESRTDLYKMLYVRCSDFPLPEHLMHSTECTFGRAVVVGALGWSVGLSFITYNDDLYKDKALGYTYLILLILWLLGSGLMMLKKFGK